LSDIVIPITETLPTRVALLKLALVSIHELAGKAPVDGGRIRAIVEEAFEKLYLCADQ
jgi:hypothetical protein